MTNRLCTQYYKGFTAICQGMEQILYRTSGTRSAVFCRLRYLARLGGRGLIHTKLNTDKQARSALLKKGGAGGFAKHTLFSKKGCPVGAAHTVITLVWASHRRKKWSRSCRRSLSLNTAASSAGLTAPRINKMLCGGHRVCHFAGGQRICVWPICSSRAGVELRREQPMGTRPKTMMVGKGRFRRPCSALQRSEPSP